MAGQNQSRDMVTAHRTRFAVAWNANGQLLGVEAERVGDVMLDLIGSLYNSTLAIVASMHGVDALAIIEELEKPGERPANANWLSASRIRDLSLYLINTEMGVPQAALARVTGLSPMALSIALRRVEDRRDDPRIDKLIMCVERILKGHQ